MKDAQLLVHSGDKSERIWDYWYYYWKKYWTCKDFIDTVFLSEIKSKDFEGVKFAHTGNIKWADGLIYYLESIRDVKWIIYQHEDYFLTKETDHNTAKVLIKICQDNELNLLKCCGWWGGYIDENAPMVENDMGGGMWSYHNNSPYLISHQTSIWDREFLLSTLRFGETPWEHELSGTARLRQRNIPLHVYRGCSPFEYAETIVHGNVRDNCEKYFEIDLGDKK